MKVQDLKKVKKLLSDTPFFASYSETEKRLIEDAEMFFNLPTDCSPDELGDKIDSYVANSS